MTRRAAIIVAFGGVLFLTCVQEALAQTNQQVWLQSLNVTRLVEGDDQTRKITVVARAPKQATVNFKVQYWPPNAEFNSGGEPFISGFQVKDGGKGRVEALLPNPFEKVGRYLIFADGSRNALRLIHQPKGLAAKLLGVADKLAQKFIDIASVLTRDRGSISPLQRISEKPELIAIWTAPMPEKGQQIGKLHLSIKAAMMPMWSPDGTMLASSVRQGSRWAIAAYPFQSGRQLGDTWRWESPDQEHRRDHDINPIWSPDGRAVAFLRATPDRKGDIWVLHLDSDGKPREEKQVTELDSVQQIIGWDKDEGILFEAFTDAQGTTGNTELMAIQMRKESKRAIPRYVALDFPYGSLLGRAPARKSIVYSKEIEGIPSFVPESAALMEITDDGNEAPLLAGEPSLNRWPAVSPDGKWLAFDSNRMQSR